MKRFVDGKDFQFHLMKEELNAGKIYKYDNCQLPTGCTPNTGCLWFGKEGETYRVCISRGIYTDIENPVFKRFLENGGAKFMSMEELADFFRSLKPLFHELGITTQISRDDAIRATESTHSVVPSTRSRMDVDDIVDKQKLRELQKDDEKRKRIRPEALSEPLKDKVFGQCNVIDSLARMVVINQMRMERRPLPIVFLGPTATGKSELAKSLAKVMTDAYGKQYDYIEIAGSELEGEQSIHRFLGAPPGYVGHGQPTLLDPVRENPYHIIVINEIEKADEKILVGLMEAIDTGKLGMADNSRPIELNRCVILFTSNLPIDMIKYESCNEFEKSEMCRDAFTKFCGRPEISGKIGNFLAFSPLTEDAKTDITVKFIREVLESFGMKLGHIDEHLMADFLMRQTKYGARGIRVFVENALGSHILKTEDLDEYKDKEVTLSGTIENIRFECT